MCEYKFCQSLVEFSIRISQSPLCQVCCHGHHDPRLHHLHPNPPHTIADYLLWESGVQVLGYSKIKLVRIEDSDLTLVGCGEDRGRGIFKTRGIGIKVSSLSSMEYDMVRTSSKIA